MVASFPTQRATFNVSFVKDLVSDNSYHGTRSMSIESFLSIRFGQDTSGSNRFAAPKPFAYSSSTTVNAAISGAACSQQKQPIPSFQAFGDVAAFSEDCLTLRVDRPANTTADAKLPVML